MKMFTTTKQLYLLLTLVLFAALSSCKKDRVPTHPAPNAPALLLKDITIPNLPSPYYHFEYNGGRVSRLAFASDLFTYDVIYDGNRISKLKDVRGLNGVTLKYYYDYQGNVSRVDYVKATGEVYKKVYLTYTGKQLTMLERAVKLSTGYFTLEKTLIFTYHPDGNLKTLSEYRPALPETNQQEYTYTDHYEQYDNKTNVDGFSLLHSEFFDHVVYLPAVVLQKNNPAHVYRTNGTGSYDITYSYNYNSKNFPQSSGGDFVWTVGDKAGQHTRLSTAYTYY